ncbi:MAG: YraN family protein [Eubacteriales bacterium]|nr:YraN family protein [Eubacteriales bacterium]
MTRNKRSIGAVYEAMAARYLTEHGYIIRARNYHSPYGELDIVAEKDSVLVVVEVKYRSGTRYGSPLEAVTRQKQRRICRATMGYYAAHGYGEERACRFDVIGIAGDGTIQHIQNAFEFQWESGG